MRHRLGLSTYGLNGLTVKVREMSTPPMPIRAWSALPLPFLLRLYHRSSSLLAYLERCVVIDMTDKEMAA